MFEIAFNNILRRFNRKYDKVCVLAREGRDARICWSVQEDVVKDRAWEARQNQLKGSNMI